MDTFEALSDLCREYLGKDTITPDTTFDELGADSLDIAELIMEVESRFDVEIPDEQLSKFRNIKDLIDFIEKN